VTGAGSCATALLPATSNNLQTMSDQTDPPAFAVQALTSRAWREHVLTRVAEQRALLAVLTENDPDATLLAAARAHLSAAEEAATAGGGGVRRALGLWLSGAAVERATGHLDAVECHLLRLGSDDYVCGAVPGAIAATRQHLQRDDPRRIALEAAARKRVAWVAADRERLIAAVHAANSQARREIRQVRSFRNALYAATLFLCVVAIGAAVVGAVSPRSMPLCFAPEGAVVCPTREMAADVPSGDIGTSGARGVVAAQRMRELAAGHDVVLIEMLGLLAAAVAAAVALRRVRGTTTPYSVPVALAILKLPLGALTALLAIVLMRGEFVPGLSALDSSGQILAWAVIFGYGQQLLSQFVDRQAHNVLDKVRSGSVAATAEPAAEPAGPPQTVPVAG
jgi:hypothetical protein